MKKTKQLSDLAIASKIKQGSDFIVQTNSERKKALTASRFLGIEIITKARADGSFVVFFPSDVPN